jgi:hypothetical protein
MEVLKAGFGWSDEEANDAFIYNLQLSYSFCIMNGLGAI